MSTHQTKESCEKVNTEFEEESHCFVDYTEPPSLQSIAITSIAVRLWTEPDVFEDVKQILSAFADIKKIDDFVNLEERVEKKLTKIFLPDKLKIEISNVISPIGQQILKLKSRLDYCDFRYIYEMGGSVYFTMDGIIDNVKSLKEKIHKEENVSRFYELACKYCLEEVISILWQKLGSARKQTQYNYNTYETCIIEYWTASMRNNLSSWFKQIKIYDFYDIFDLNHGIGWNLTSLSVFVGNIFALKYFWPKMSEQEKNSSVRKWINMTLQKLDNSDLDFNYRQCNPFADILFFLLSKLNNPSKQKRVFQTRSKIILKALLFCWPWERFFLPTIRQMIDYLPKHDYIETMSIISRQINDGRTTENVFREVWINSPIKLKQTLLPSIEDTIWRLLRINDIITIDMILDILSGDRKKDLALSMIRRYEFIDIVSSGDFLKLDKILHKLLPSEDERRRFKKQILLNKTHTYLDA